jgi:hypothetical protein
VRLRGCFCAHASRWLWHPVILDKTYLPRQNGRAGLVAHRSTVSRILLIPWIPGDGDPGDGEARATGAGRVRAVATAAAGDGECGRGGGKVPSSLSLSATGGAGRCGGERLWGGRPAASLSELDVDEAAGTCRSRSIGDGAIAALYDGDGGERARAGGECRVAAHSVCGAPASPPPHQAPARACGTTQEGGGEGARTDGVELLAPARHLPQRSNVADRRTQRPVLGRLNLRGGRPGTHRWLRDGGGRAGWSRRRGRRTPMAEGRRWACARSLPQSQSSFSYANRKAAAREVRWNKADVSGGRNARRG